MFLHRYLGWVEVWHALNHVLVLCGLFHFSWLPEKLRKLYFPLDLATCLLSSLLILWHGRRRRGANMALVTIDTSLCLVHLLVHAATLMFWESWFFQDVFQLAEYKFCNKAPWLISLYMTLTLADIAAHCLNAYLLLLGLPRFDAD